MIAECGSLWLHLGHLRHWYDQVIGEDFVCCVNLFVFCLFCFLSGDQFKEFG